MIDDPAEYAPRDLQALGGYRSVLGVPLLRDGFAIGVALYLDFSFAVVLVTALCLLA